MACMICIVAALMVSLSAPNGSINRKYTFLRRILKDLEGPGGSNRANNQASRTVGERVGGGMFSVYVFRLDNDSVGVCPIVYI